MTTPIQTFIKERETLFDKLLSVDFIDDSIGDNGEIIIGQGEVVTGDIDKIKSFHRQSLQDLLALVAEEVGKVMKEVEDETPLMVKNQKTGDYSCAYCGIKPEKITEALMSLLRSSLQVKE